MGKKSNRKKHNGRMTPKLNLSERDPMVRPVYDIDKQFQAEHPEALSWVRLAEGGEEPFSSFMAPGTAVKVTVVTTGMRFRSLTQLPAATWASLMQGPQVFELKPADWSEEQGLADFASAFGLGQSEGG